MSFRKRLEPLIEWLIEQRKNKKKHQQMGKNYYYVGCYSPKIWQILKHFKRNKESSLSIEKVPRPGQEESNFILLYKLVGERREERDPPPQFLVLWKPFCFPGHGRPGSLIHKNLRIIFTSKQFSSFPASVTEAWSFLEMSEVFRKCELIIRFAWLAHRTSDEGWNMDYWRGFWRNALKISQNLKQLLNF